MEKMPMDNQNALCEIHHTPLINGQCVVCNRDEDRDDLVRESSRGWREPEAREESKGQREKIAMGDSDSSSKKTFRELFTEGVREQLGDSPLADKILERQKPTPAREAEPRHRAAHIKKKKLR